MENGLTLSDLAALGSLAGVVVVAAGSIWWRISSSARSLYGRIERLEKDHAIEFKEIRHEYVRRDDLSDHMSGFDKKLDGAVVSIERMGVRFDALQQALISRAPQKS